LPAPPVSRTIGVATHPMERALAEPTMQQLVAGIEILRHELRVTREIVRLLATKALAFDEMTKIPLDLGVEIKPVLPLDWDGRDAVQAAYHAALTDLRGPQKAT